MAEYIFNQNHVRLINVLHEWSQEAGPNGTRKLWEFDDVQNELAGLEVLEVENLMEAMASLGAVKVESGPVYHPQIFTINSFKTEQLKRKFDKEVEELQSKPAPDMVEKLKLSARSSPVGAKLIIGFIVATAAVTFLNQLTSLVKTVIEFLNAR